MCSGSGHDEGQVQVRVRAVTSPTYNMCSSGDKLFEHHALWRLSAVVAPPMLPEEVHALQNFKMTTLIIIRIFYFSHTHSHQNQILCATTTGIAAAASSLF